jgi:hypothetical protein
MLLLSDFYMQSECGDKCQIQLQVIDFMTARLIGFAVFEDDKVT